MSNTQEEIVGFGAAMVSLGEFDTARELQDYYEKPHKWHEERMSWIDAGKPIGDHPNWFPWTETVQAMLGGED